MTTRLTLMCHASTAATRGARFPRDEPLDPRGEAAAARAAASPAVGAEVTRAGRRLAAPAARTRQTAAAFALPFEDDHALRDQDCGRWAGRSIAEIAAGEPEALAIWMADPSAAPQAGESLEVLFTRMAGWMADQAALGGRVVAVTHPAILRAVCVVALAAGPGSFWRIEAPPLAIATLSHDGRRWTLVALGEAGA